MTVFPILGAKKAEQFHDNIAALDTKLSQDHLTRLGEASAMPPGFPHDFLARMQNDEMPVKLFGVPRDRMELSAHTF